MKLRKLPLIKPETIKSAYPDYEGYCCTKCSCGETEYFYTDLYVAKRKWPSYWDTEIVLCTRCAREEGWVW